MYPADSVLAAIEMHLRNARNTALSPEEFTQRTDALSALRTLCVYDRDAAALALLHLVDLAHCRGDCSTWTDELARNARDGIAHLTAAGNYDAVRWYRALLDQVEPPSRSLPYF